MLPLNANVHAVAHALTSARQLMNCYQKATPAPAHSYKITASDDTTLEATGRTVATRGLKTTLFLYHMLMFAVFKSERQLERKDEYNINPL